MLRHGHLVKASARCPWLRPTAGCCDAVCLRKTAVSIVKNFCFFLSDSLDTIYVTHTALERNPSGWTTYSVTDQRGLLATVLTTVGAYTTVVMSMTCPSHASTFHSELRLSRRGEVAVFRHVMCVPFCTCILITTC